MANPTKLWKLQKYKSTFGGRVSNIVPRHAEKLAYSMNRRWGQKPSAFDPTQTVEDPTNSFTICPRCKSEGPLLQHGDYAQCSCGLMMQVHGNVLSVWIGEWPAKVRQRQ